ncbi:hypothetical protein [Phaeobacter sp. HF9A]|uniref:hypothetical protein n=1 Tax=Phaeobacter sp. HF9A TaxID=2721561 RepID=UPI0014312CA7|nr:hypothetical protein [Phaeobacter sp. HF9A]NIZ13620.1 hypothetical protein [Phaeobacter sp. HF9A]
MAIAGILFGMIAGFITASIGLLAFDLSFWICLALYSLVGAFSTLAITTIAYFLRSSTAAWLKAGNQETAVG